MFNQPIFFERNRVGRVYTGGKLFADLFGDEPIDGFLPEEWIASAVKAINKDSTDPNEGVSKVKGSDIYFDELLKKYPKELLGSSETVRILVKGLDSAIRLPAQAHPDREFSKKHFNSTFGKTECWVMLGTRPDAKLYFGFKEGVTREQFIDAIDQSEYDSHAMESLMKTVTPKVGEVYFVPAKTVHAIGKGCLILEVQEPTDFTIQPEYYCGDYRLNDKEMYLGLSKETAVECFNFGTSPDPLLIPRITLNENGVKKEALVDSSNTDCFIINRITLTDADYTANVDDSYAIYIVTDGNGCVSGEGYEKALKKGDYFFMPAAAQGKFTLSGNLTVVECY